MNTRAANGALVVAAWLQRASDRLTAFVYDHVDTTLLPSEEVAVDPPRRSCAVAPGRAEFQCVEYHMHFSGLAPDLEPEIRAAVRRMRGLR